MSPLLSAANAASRVTLGKELGRGAEGIVYAVAERSKEAVKMKRDGAPLDHREVERLAALIDLGLATEPTPDPRLSCAWPTELVSGADGRPVGFSMKRAPFAPIRLARMLSVPSREQLAPNLSFQTVSEIGANLACLVGAIHAGPGSVVLCDLNDRGVLLGPGGELMLADLDSAQFVDAAGVGYLSPLHTEDYLAPELVGLDLNGSPRERSSDDYSLAYLLFRTLMIGFSPYDGRRTDGQPADLAKHGAAGLYAYGAGASEIRPPSKSPSIDVLSADVKDLFERAFVAGAADPTARPTAGEFEVALRRQAQSLVRCSGPRAHMSIASGSGECEWCKWESGIGLSKGPPKTRRTRRPAKPAPLPKAKASVNMPGAKPPLAPPPVLPRGLSGWLAGKGAPAWAPPEWRLPLLAMAIVLFLLLLTLVT